MVQQKRETLVTVGRGQSLLRTVPGRRLSEQGWGLAQESGHQWDCRSFIHDHQKEGRRCGRGHKEVW